jgi:hypothetical protein
LTAPDDWYGWLHHTFPSYVAYPFADRHRAFWEWVWAIEPGVRPAPFVAIWPRGGAKSTSVELATVMLGVRRQRKYAIYVSGTQEQADKHVQAIARLLERLGVERALNRYGHARGWRRNQVRTADGFTVEAFGLDTGARGAKLDEVRPDLLILDDVDDLHDAPETTAKKIETITMTLLPAGSPDAAVLAVQNLIFPGSIFDQLQADGTATFLLDRIVSGPHPALVDYSYEEQTGSDGRKQFVVSGTPTWAGQSLEACQNYATTWGVAAFERECQHLIASPVGLIYDSFKDYAAVIGGHLIPRIELDPTWQRYMGLDFGGTNTAAVFFAEEPGTRRLYLYRTYHAGGRTAREHAEELRKGEPMVPFCVGGSQSEGQWRLEFRRGGLPVNEPDISDVWLGIGRVYGTHKRSEILVFDDLAEYRQEKRTYRRKVDATGKPTNDIQNKNAFHLLDAERYIIGRIRRGM